jgi:hypothetical protein
MALSASALRQNIYRILDHILETGVPLDIERNKRRLRIVPVEKRRKLGNLKKRDLIKCAPEEVVHMDWSKEWRP